jgi:hypothetical protein
MALCAGAKLLTQHYVAGIRVARYLIFFVLLAKPLKNTIRDFKWYKIYVNTLNQILFFLSLSLSFRLLLWRFAPVQTLMYTASKPRPHAHTLLT